MFGTLKRIIGRGGYQAALQEKNSVDAYNLWAENYDRQPGNLMLDLDNEIFTVLLAGIDLSHKQVADIGCGTGRHWNKIFACNPQSLTGFDVSPGMLDRLQAKFPQANTQVIKDNLFTGVADASFDAIISTLTVAHIKDIEQALRAWCRILKDDSDLIITDFHPDAIAFGGKRTFEHEKKQVAVQNFVHYVGEIRAMLLKYGFSLVRIEERKVDEPLKHYYMAKNALPVYEKFKGSKIIYGMHLKRG